jgi:hypothetical protein
MSEHLPSVMRAAKRIARAFMLAESVDSSIADMIEQETGLQELLAAAEDTLESIYKVFPRNVSGFGVHALRAAIALVRKEKP